MAEILGIDISVYQGKVDFAKAKAAGARFVYARASLADTYDDPRFFEHVQGARAAGLPCGAYHVVAPDRSASAQIGNFLSLVDQVELQLPPVLDCELDRKQSVATITANIRDCIAALLSRGLRPIIYTRASWWNIHVKHAALWKQYDLWTAHYTTLPKPLIPVDWSKHLIHQYSADGNLRGAEFGAQSKSIDLNRFNGDEAAFLAWSGQTAPPPPALTIEQRVDRLEAEGRAHGWSV